MGGSCCSRLSSETFPAAAGDRNGGGQLISVQHRNMSPEEKVPTGSICSCSFIIFLSVNCGGDECGQIVSKSEIFEHVVRTVDPESSGSTFHCRGSSVAVKEFELSEGK